jgi:ubiquinone/menaquinone biosynthesis C-methylase UbiE/aminoglycoside phosphotransferase (APT) family kinase protein
LSTKIIEAAPSNAPMNRSAVPDSRLFACPSCRGDLDDQAAHLACRTCGLSFDVRDGIVDLRQHRKDYYFNPVKRERMRELIARCARTPWRETVRGFMREVGDNPDWLDNLVVDGRYAWRLLLDLPQDAVALDLGCGLGNLAMNLAGNVGHIVGMDLTMERLEFARERFALFGREGGAALVAAGDGRYLPFRSGSFDLVTLSGVLEWIPDDERAWEGGSGKLARALRMVRSQFGATNPRRVQIEFLREIGRILKPRGQVFIAIENRLGYEYFLGMPDHHSGLAFNSLLPRFLANLYSIARARRPYRTYTYSIPGFVGLFRRAGYSAQEFYGLTPGYTHLSEIAPALARNPIWEPSPRSGLVSRIKGSAAFVPAYGVVVSKSADTVGSALINRLADRIRRETGETGAFHVARFRITGKDKAVLDARLGERDVVLRIALNDLADRAERRNFDIVSTGRAQPAAAALMPEPILCGVEQGLPFYVESRIAGVTLTEALASGGAEARSLAAEAASLPQRYNADALADTTELAGADYERLVVEPLDRVAAACGTPEGHARLAASLRRSLCGAPVRLGLFHGDLTTDNILVDRQRIRGVIDWEEGDPRGLPLLDTIAYLESLCRLRRPGLTVATTFASLAGSLDLLSPPEIAALDDTFAGLATPPSLRREMALLAWIHHCDALLRTPASFDADAMERRAGGLFRVAEQDAERHGTSAQAPAPPAR